MNDQLQTLIRSVLKVGGGYLISKGIADDSQIETIAAGLVVLIAVVWGWMHRTPKAGSAGSQTASKMVPLLVFGALMVWALGCGTPKLEQGGAYAPSQTNVVDGATNVVATIAPDIGFYTVDSAFRLAWGIVDAAFGFEQDNRAMLWKLSPDIKKTLDGIRPDAVAAWQAYAKARENYQAHPTPAGLDRLNSILSRMQQWASAAQAVLPSQSATKPSN